MAFTQVIKTLGSVMETMKTAVNSWLSQNITNPSNPPLDRSLSLSNACAPADMVGDLKDEIQTKNTWNLWPFNDSYVLADNVVLGTLGTDILPAGTYSLEVDITTTNKVLLYVYSGSGQSAYYELALNQISNGKGTFLFTSNEAIQRFMLKVNANGTATVSNIQLENIDWQAYRGSPSPANMYPMPYGSPYTQERKTLVDLEARLYPSNWVGKKIIFNGDSVTQANGVAGYVKVINQLLRFGVVKNYAIGGTRLAHVEGQPNCLIDRLSVMQGDTDIIFIMANTNDYASQVPLGASDSLDTSTYNGALNVLMNYLRTNFPTQPIIISTMLTRKENTSGGQPLPITIEQYADCVRQRTLEHHLILYDAYNLSGMDLATSPTDGTGITNDGLHPNTAGELALGRKVASFINAQ